MSPKLSRLSKSDLETLRHQICDGWKERRQLRSPYACWLGKQLLDYETITGAHHTYLGVHLAPTATMTVLEQLKALMLQRTTALHKEIQRQKHITESYMLKSMNSLSVYSARGFDEGDTLEKKERLWDGAVFTLNPSQKNRN
jgi:hypothetical protein